MLPVSNTPAPITSRCPYGNRVVAAAGTGSAASRTRQSLGAWSMTASGPAGGCMATTPVNLCGTRRIGAARQTAGSAGRPAGPASAGMAVLIERETSGGALGTWVAEQTLDET